MNTRRSSDDVGPPVSGDPGVGGLLADPLANDRHRDEIDPDAGEPTEDPAPPRQHHDWSPNKQPDTDTKDDSDA